MKLVERWLLVKSFICLKYFTDKIVDFKPLYPRTSMFYDHYLTKCDFIILSISSLAPSCLRGNSIDTIMDPIRGYFGSKLVFMALLWSSIISYFVKGTLQHAVLFKM